MGSDNPVPAAVDAVAKAEREYRARKRDALMLLRQHGIAPKDANKVLHAMVREAAAALKGADNNGR